MELLFNLYHINNLMIEGARQFTIRGLESNRPEYNAPADKYRQGSVELLPRIRLLHGRCKELTERMLAHIALHDRDNPLKKPTLRSLFDEE